MSDLFHTHKVLMHLVRPAPRQFETYCGKALGYYIETAEGDVWYAKHKHFTLHITDKSVKTTCERCMEVAGNGDVSG